jgi:hypothetical protein
MTVNNLLRPSNTDNKVHKLPAGAGQVVTVFAFVLVYQDKFVPGDISGLLRNC